MSNRKTTVSHVFFGIVNTLRDYQQISPKREKNRVAVKKAVAGLVDTALILVADQKDDETLMNWASHAVISGSTQLMESFPERAYGLLRPAGGPRMDWQDALQNAEPDYLRACYTRGVSLQPYERELLRRAIEHGDADLQSVLLDTVAPHAQSLVGVMGWTPKVLAACADFVCAYLRLAIEANPKEGALAMEQAAARYDGIQYALLRLCGAEAQTEGQTPGQARLRAISNHRWISVLGGHCTPEALLADAVQRDQAENIFRAGRI